MSRPPSRWAALTALALTPCLALLTPTPGLSSGLTASTGDPTAPLVALVGLAAWGCTGWLLLVTMLTWCSDLPGVLGRAASAGAGRLAPAAVRGLVRVAVGTSVAATVLSGPASALAGDAVPPAPVLAGSASDPLDWPELRTSPQPSTVTPPTPPAPTASASATATLGVGAPSARPIVPRPRATPRRSRPAAPSTGVPSRSVVVRAGDCLWALAAAELGPEADDRRIAQQWPRWWSANRAVIGDHPDLIHPGDRLTVPDPS